jgi:glycosyltransferase involved in cell wall biosynthesis
MRINYISNYRDGTAWSKAATYNILALKEAGYDVYLKLIRYNNEVSTLLHPDLSEIELKHANEFDMTIFHSLPINFSYEKNNSKTQFVGMAALESYTLDNIYWQKKFKLMDRVFSANSLTKNTLNNYEINSSVFKQSFDFDAVFNSVKKSKINVLDSSFNFVFEGDSSKISNLESLLIAFHSEFSVYEPVNIVIKSLSSVDEFCTNVKKNLKLSKRYKKEVTVYGGLNDEDYYSILRHCHAFVCPNRGISWCQSALEAMTIGLPVIYTAGNGLDDYVNSYAMPVSSTLDNCYGAEGFDDLLTGRDLWSNPKISSLRYQMRSIYETYKNNLSQYLEISKATVQNASQYNYKTMKNHIDSIIGGIK